MSLDYSAYVIYGVFIPGKKLLLKQVKNPDYLKPNPLWGQAKFHPDTGRQVTEFLSTEKYLERESRYDELNDLACEKSLNLSEVPGTDEMNPLYLLGEILRSGDGSGTCAYLFKPLSAERETKLEMKIEKILRAVNIDPATVKFSYVLLTEVS